MIVRMSPAAPPRTARIAGRGRGRLAAGAGVAMVMALLTASPSAMADQRIDLATPTLSGSEIDSGVHGYGLHLAQAPRSLIDGFGSRGSSVQPIQSLSSDYAASVETRIQALEREISELTGQVEELRFRNEQLAARLDRVLNDVEFRLSELESTGSGAAGQNAQQSNGTVDQSVASGAGTGAEPASGNGDTGGERSVSGDGEMTDTIRTLGTIPLTGGRPAPPEESAGSGNRSGGTSAPQSNAADSGFDAGDAMAELPLPQGESGEASADYDEAYGLLTRGRYSQAEEAFRAFIDRHSGHRLADNARYWLGETFYIRERYEDAARTFASAYQQSPEGNKAPDNLLKLGLSLASLDQREDACTALTRVSENFPDAPGAISDRARQELSRLSC